LSKKKNNIKNTGIIAFPSQKKLKTFFNYFNFKDYVSMVIEGNEYNSQSVNSEHFNIKKFSNQNIVDSKVAIQMLSIFSSITVGLNLPQLFFLHVSLNNYKPNKLNYSNCVKINDRYINIDFYNIIESLIQVIGRLTRAHKDETYTCRVLHSLNTSPYLDFTLFGILIPHLKKSFKKINIIQLKKYEEMVFIIKNSRSLKKYLSFYNTKLNTKNNINLKNLGKSYSNFKISLIWLLKNKHKFTQKRFNFLFNLILLKYLKSCRLFATKIIICEIYHKLAKETDDILTYSQFYKIKKHSFLIKINAYEDLYNIIELSYNIFIVSKQNTFDDFIFFSKQFNDNIINKHLNDLLDYYMLEITEF
jgi:hypothetical protein